MSLSSPATDNPAFAYLDHYLDRAPHGEGVVLVTGPWGTGKTHTLRAYLRARDARILRREPLGDKHIYISVFGVSSIDQIYERLFAAKHPLFGSAFAKGVATILTRFGNWATNGGAVQASDAASIRKYLLSLRDAVVVLDDLERAAMPVSEIMGYLNTLVEHEKIKAILVANEDGLVKAWPEFAEGKEKLVARTVTLKSSAAEVYDQFVARMRTPEAAKAAEATKDQVMDVFRESGLPNLRSLRVALDDFDRLVAEVDEPLRRSERALAMIPPIMVAMWIAIRAGELSVDALDDGMAHYEAFVVRSGKEDGPTPSQAAAFLLRHGTLNWTDVPVPLEALAAFAGSGELRLDVINQAAAQHPAVVGLAEVQPWRRLWRWRNLSVGEFDRAIAEVRTQCREFELRHPEELLHVLGIALDLENNDYRLFGPRPLVVMTEYVDRLLDQNLLVPSDVGLDGFGNSGLGYSSQEHPDFGVYREHLGKAVLLARDRALKEASGPLLNEIAAGNYRPLHEYGLEEGNYATIPILHHLDVAAFTNILLRDGVLAKGLPSALIARYRSWGGEPHPLLPEATWIDEVFAAVSDQAGRLSPPHRKAVLDSIESTFARIKTSLGKAGA